MRSRSESKFSSGHRLSEPLQQPSERRLLILFADGMPQRADNRHLARLLRVSPDGERQRRPAWQAGKVTTPNHSTINSGHRLWGCKVQDVAFGSSSTELGCPRHVRFTPGLDRWVDPRFGSFVPKRSSRSETAFDNSVAHRLDLFGSFHAVAREFLVNVGLDRLRCRDVGVAAAAIALLKLGNASPVE